MIRPGAKAIRHESVFEIAIRGIVNRPALRVHNYVAFAVDTLATILTSDTDVDIEGTLR